MAREGRRGKGLGGKGDFLGFLEVAEEDAAFGGYLRGTCTVVAGVLFLKNRGVTMGCETRDEKTFAVISGGYGRGGGGVFGVILRARRGADFLRGVAEGLRKFFAIVARARCRLSAGYGFF